MLADIPTSSHRLLSTGLLPGWAGILLFVGATAFVVFQLRRDLAGIKPTRLTRWILPPLRITIVGLFAWLLCQPVLLIVRRWTPPPEVLLVVDSGNSMRVNEGAGEVSRQLDALDAVGKPPIAKRNNAASQIARACANVGRATASALTSLQEDQVAASTGLPLGPSVGRKLESLGAQLRIQGDFLALARSQLPSEIGDKELNKSIAEIAAASQVVSAAIDGIVADGPVVGREASKSPSLLDVYTGRLKALVISVDSLHKRAAGLQVKLDSTLLTAKDVEEVRAQALTREALAEMAADRLATQASSAPSASSGHARSSDSGQAHSALMSWNRQRSSSLATTIDDAFRKTLESPLAAVVVLSDGSSPLPVTNGSAAAALAQLHVPVNTILIGSDGEEPADAGLIAVEAPRLVLAGEPATIRCLVKNLVTTTPPPKLTLTIGKDKVAARDLPVTRSGPEVIEFAWTPSALGRVQAVFGIESAQPDAYPGNETAAAIIDVIGSKARVLIVSDRLTGDFSAVSQLLASMPAVESHAILAAPGLSKFHAGSKSDEFPATADDFKALSLLVLIGDVPEPAGSEVIQSLKQAVDSGLRVWVQAPAAQRSAKPWTSALGLETRVIPGRHSIEPRQDLWLDLYQLGRETDESGDRWRELPPADGLNEIVAPGISLLTADHRPVMELVPRKAGAVLVSGISNFTAMRTSLAAASVNRLLSESLLLALTPPWEPGLNDGIFPPQPVYERNVTLIGATSVNKGLDVAGSNPDGGKRVVDPHAVVFQAGGASIERIVRHLVSRQDFQLAAHDAPLEKISQETGGRHRDMLSMMDILPPGLVGTPHVSTTRLPLWAGPWSLIVLLVLVSAEYLLRRGAGKVM